MPCRMEEGCMSVSNDSEILEEKNGAQDIIAVTAEIASDFSSPQTVKRDNVCRYIYRYCTELNI